MTLKTILSNMIDHTRLHPDQLFKTKLKGCLVISMLLDPLEPHYINLKLHRANCYPPTIEWYTVLNHMPFFAHIAPTKCFKDGHFVLHAHISILQDNLFLP